ncbi:MAG TPA: beta-ketoacyl-[acyl-carrier-protein] synthase family protein [Candidatus Omnitrophota bacterium]|nr:beta-ketoacyl-[acyl-carrier-protein] synthase family protein [Candidatus Omnitrophota bacterium]HPD85623.1 beta-ketoacyl-[acyl-carrier-protein] synthase family protein [Candidatus Omnitrophota bacterium]HRZ04466.1 beta-ketoacyl-[acyl-carrier-protein] synthase family protein [Candidatus Omnitrophota bacterium]
MKNLLNNRRVVVTGLGVISSLGIGWELFWKNLMAGKSGISRIEAFDTSAYDRHYGGEIKNFDPTQFMNKRRVARMGRASQMAVAASRLAIKDSKILFETLRDYRVGICMGTTMGESRVIENIIENNTKLERISVQGILALAYPANSISTNVSHELNIKGENIIFANACAAGNYAIGRAFDLIRSNKADFMLAGGVDALSRIAFTGFGRLFAMAPEKCQPFDKNRKGMILGEGAGILLLEALESAQKRKAHIYAEVLGYGLSCDAQNMTTPSIEGVACAIMRSIKNLGADIGAVDYISAHGTGTPENDGVECKAIAKVFGSRAQKIPTSSIKSMLGHTMGAAAALEAIACCLAIQKQEIPPTINLEEQDPECEIDCVANKGRKHKASVVLNNSQAFGGNNACLVLKDYK